MEKGEVRDGRLVRAVPFRIYLPACAGKPGFERLPALYLLHGLTYDDGQWDRLGAPALADQMIAAGEAPPFLMVMPWERTGLDMDLAITDVLLPYIETKYPSGAGSRLRAIGGLSRGGGWALRIGLRHPWTFGAIGLHSPAVISPDLFWLSAWAEGLTPNGTPRVWIDIGQRDGLRPEAVALEATLDELGISAALVVNPGEHTEAYWAEHIPEYLAWYVTPWREMALP
jgi:enterochelin esterase-like enzyme